MKRWKDHVAVVTGAAGRVGRKIAHKLVKRNVFVAAMDTNEEQMEENRCDLDKKYHEFYHCIKCDVTDPASVQKAFDHVEKDLCGVDILVNSAEINSPGQLLTHDVKELKRVWQVNVMGAVHCTQLAYKSMVKRSFDGQIILVNSIMGHNVFQPTQGALPEFNMYPLTKYALTAMTEVLRQELRDHATAIKVTSISPGFVANNIAMPEYCKYFNTINPKDVAKAVIYVLETPDHVQVHELTLKPIGELV